MTSRDLVLNTLNHEPVDRAPRDLWASAEVESTRADELAEIEVQYPRDIVRTESKYPPGKRAKGKPGRVGYYTDSWGCIWHVSDRGGKGEAEPPLLEPEQIDEYTPPFEIIDGADLSNVNRECAATSRFVLAYSETRPFEQLQLLRGSDTALLDLSHGTKEIRGLLAKLHDFFCRELEMWARTDVDGVVFMDNWGSRQSLLISEEIWRDLFMPLYRDYCEIIHSMDKFAFFCSDGDISSIFGDLVKVGVDAINSQLSLMNVERLAKKFRGHTTFWGGVDHQYAMPYGTPDDVRKEVLRVRKVLDFGSGGAIAQCQWEVDVPMNNIAAVFEQWMAPLPMHVT